MAGNIVEGPKPLADLIDETDPHGRFLIFKLLSQIFDLIQASRAHLLELRRRGEIRAAAGAAAPVAAALGSTSVRRRVRYLLQELCRNTIDDPGKECAVSEGGFA